MTENCKECGDYILLEHHFHKVVHLADGDAYFHESCWQKYVSRCYHEYANALVKQRGGDPT